MFVSFLHNAPNVPDDFVELENLNMFVNFVQNTPNVPTYCAELENLIKAGELCKQLS
jgi:hypothetical protein